MGERRRQKQANQIAWESMRQDARHHQQMMAIASGSRPGWYPDPWAMGNPWQRYWNGEWTIDVIDQHGTPFQYDPADKWHVKRAQEAAHRLEDDGGASKTPPEH